LSTVKFKIPHKVSALCGIIIWDEFLIQVVIIMGKSNKKTVKKGQAKLNIEFIFVLSEV
jgi:hypothetical protein